MSATTIPEVDVARALMPPQPRALTPLVFVSSSEVSIHPFITVVVLLGVMMDVVALGILPPMRVLLTYMLDRALVLLVCR
jgi:hypothetical protein